MPSAFSHSAVALAIGAMILPSRQDTRLWFAGAACAVVPDIDALGRPFGFGDFDWLGGHRGITHSLVFAAVCSLVISYALRNHRLRRGSVRIWTFFFLCFALHGVVDALAAYGPGVSFLAPFSHTRFTFRWQPIDPAALNAGRRGPLLRSIGVFQSEFLWIWVPCFTAVAAFYLVRFNRQRTAKLSGGKP